MILLPIDVKARRYESRATGADKPERNCACYRHYSMRHATAVAAFARLHLDSDRVLPRLLELADM